MTTSLFINLTGLIALALNLHGLLRPSDSSLRAKSGFAAALWSVNNLLLGAHSAAALSMLVVGRQFAAHHVQNQVAHIRRWTCLAFIGMTLFVGVATWQGWSTAFTSAGTVLATWAMFYLAGSKLRLAMLLTSCLWLAHAWVFDAWWQMFANVAGCIAAGVGAYSLHKSEQKASSPPSP